MDQSKFAFSADWFSGNAPNWARLFSDHLPNASKILEIGSYEGRSTIWLAENASARGLAGKIICIDTWSGGEEHDISQMSQIESRFDHNVAVAQKEFPGASIVKMKGRSHDVMVRLLAAGHRESFDFIYVDGSHQAADVLGDLVLAFLLCKVQGIIACDDYLWGEGSENILHRPKVAIDAFANCFQGKIKVIWGFALYQLYLMKIAN